MKKNKKRIKAKVKDEGSAIRELNAQIPELPRVERFDIKEVKDNEAAEPGEEGGAAILLIAGLGLGLWLWVRNRKAQAALVAKQFSQRLVKPSRPAKPQGKQVSQQWQPESYHWRGG